MVVIVHTSPTRFIPMLIIYTSTVISIKAFPVIDRNTALSVELMPTAHIVTSSFTTIAKPSILSSIYCRGNKASASKQE
jgi:hypothetical protein